MSSPSTALGKLEPESASLNWEPTKVVSLKPTVNMATDGFKQTALTTVIGSFKYISDNRDHKLIDFLLIGLVSILVHNTVIDHFKDFSFEQEIVEAIKPPPKVQITLTRTQPKPVAPPPPKVQPKPPIPKVVPLKPQKPKPVQKVLEQAPTPAPTQVVESAPTSPIAAPSPVAPPAPVVEKVTAPIAGADYGDRPDPIYPEHAQEMGWEGKVLLKVHVQANGKPASVNVSKSSGHQELDDAAVKAVTKWTFKPAMRGDTPTDGFVSVPITFNI